MFPHTVTLYNTITDTDKSTYEQKTVNNITILSGVLLDASKGANVRKSGFEGADAVNLYIPLDVSAVDGLTGEPKQYVRPVEFWRLEDKTGCWTLSVGQNTWFVRGEALPYLEWPEDTIYNHIVGLYDDVYNVTKVDIKDFGGLQHWEVGGT